MAAALLLKTKSHNTSKIQLQSSKTQLMAVIHFALIQIQIIMYFSSAVTLKSAHGQTFFKFSSVLVNVNHTMLTSPPRPPPQKNHPRVTMQLKQ